MSHLVAQASKCKQPKWCHLFGYSQGSVEPSSHSENSSSVTTSTAVNTWAWRSPGCCCCTAGWSTERYPTIFSVCPPQTIVWPLLHFLRLHSYCHCIFSIQSWEDSRFWSMKILPMGCPYMGFSGECSEVACSWYSQCLVSFPLLLFTLVFSPLFFISSFFPVSLLLVAYPAQHSWVFSYLVL
jgi:hypothetical protein